MSGAVFRAVTFALLLALSGFMPEKTKKTLNAMSCACCVVSGSAGICAKGAWLCSALFGEWCGAAVLGVMTTASFFLFYVLSRKERSLLTAVLYIMLVPCPADAVGAIASGADCALCGFKENGSLRRIALLTVCLLVGTLLGTGRSPVMIVGCCAAVYSGMERLRRETEDMSGSIAGVAVGSILYFLR